ncbi:MAG: alkaline phosphatase family protein [Candidatus Latescibacterota bacterium]|nr:MAG: alkaline phosphatase family protein [Candidatus Latescibacterota bacterium]
MMKRISIIAAIVCALIIAGLVIVIKHPSSPFRSSENKLEYMRSAGVRQRSFSTWEEFLSHNTDAGPDRHRVVFIGIDGAAWNLIDPMIDAGLLPTFNRLKHEGCYGVLRSTDCYVSPPAWCSMMTGRVPEKTGIYTFGHWDRKHKEFLPVRSTDITTPSIWDIASQAGRKTGVINVPMTYPVREVNGILVSGLMTPTQLGDRHSTPVEFTEFKGAGAAVPKYPTFSPRLHAATVFSGNRFTFFLIDTTDDKTTNYDYVTLVVDTSATAEPSTGAKQTHLFPLNTFSPWVKILHTREEETQKAWCKVGVVRTENADRAYIASFSRVLFSTGDTDVPFAYPDSLAKVLQREFGYYFPSKFLDRAIVPEYTRDSANWASFFYGYDDWDLFLYVFTQTDNIQHLEGDSRLTQQVYQTIDRFLADLIEDLPRNSTLIIASDHGFTGHTHAFDLNRFFEQINLLRYKEGDEIDHENTLVFHNMWCLYFNRSLVTRSELEKRDIYIGSGETPEDALVKYIQEAGRSLRLGRDRKPFPLEFSRVDADAVGFAPDMYIEGSYTDYVVEFWNLRHPSNTVVRRLRNDEQWNHTRSGIYMLFGDRVRRGVEGLPGDIQDIATTMLYLLGLPIALDMEGRVMTQTFEEDDLASQTCYLVDTFDQLMPRVAIDKDRDSLEKELRSLGYIR